MKQMPLALGVDVVQSFDNFIAQDNVQVVQHLEQSILELEQAQLPAPVYLWGEPGCGKTHLLHAVMSSVKASGFKCGCLNRTACETFTVDEDWKVVLMDDCEQFSRALQAAAFRAFIDAQTFGIWVVAAGALPPVALPLRDDLRTRLGWGDIFALKPLSDEALQAAIWHACHERGLSIGKEVFSYIVHHFSRDMATIMQLVARLDEYALSTKRNITVPLIKEMLQIDAKDQHNIK